MRNVLCIAYHFPPVGGAGVQRSIKFVRYLPAYDYEFIVVTGPGAPGRWSPLDETLRNEVGAATVHRALGPEPSLPGGLRGRADRIIGRTAFGPWWVDQVAAIAQQLGDVDLVYTSLGPYESADAAAHAAGQLGRPWVADLRDPWALDEMMVYPTALHRRRALRRMKSSLSTAAAIVMNTPEAADRLLDAFPEFAGKVIATIPNGFDAEDFAGPVPSRTDDQFRIAHTGYLHTELGRRHRKTALMRRLLGGAVAGVDILTRSHLFLLDAIAEVQKTDPELGRCVELHLAGVLSVADRLETGHDVVHVHGYVPHLESVGLLRSADLLFLPMQNLPPGRRATIVPGKTYEYLAAGRPILAAVPDGDARDLLVESGGARICRPDDVKCLAEALRAEVRAWRDSTDRPEPRAEIAERYERRRLTARLAEVFDRVLVTQGQRTSSHLSEPNRRH